MKLEEERFAETLANGMSLLEGEIKETRGTMIDGETVFKLYDTYGFPADLTADHRARARNAIDQAGFDAAMRSSASVRKTPASLARIEQRRLD